jgi:hypothetical protein
MSEKYNEDNGLLSIIGTAIAAGSIAYAVGQSNKTPEFGTIATETIQKDKVEIVITSDRGPEAFNCDPKSLRRKLGLSPKDIIAGKQFKSLWAFPRPSGAN